MSAPPSPARRRGAPSATAALTLPKTPPSPTVSLSDPSAADAAAPRPGRVRPSSFRAARRRRRGPRARGPAHSRREHAHEAQHEERRVAIIIVGARLDGARDALRGGVRAVPSKSEAPYQRAGRVRTPSAMSFSFHKFRRRRRRTPAAPRSRARPNWRGAYLKQARPRATCAAVCAAWPRRRRRRAARCHSMARSGLSGTSKALDAGCGAPLQKRLEVRRERRAAAPLFVGGGAIPYNCNRSATASFNKSKASSCEAAATTRRNNARSHARSSPRARRTPS